MRFSGAPVLVARDDGGAGPCALAPRQASGRSAPRLGSARPPRFRPPVPVVCIGNYVVGGAGKTPTVIALRGIARGAGLKPGFLTRGYGGTVGAPVIVDPAVHGAIEVGDEALLLAAAAPTVVARDRVLGARRLLEDGVDLIIMDDGFQNPALAKDLTVVAVDAASGIGNGHVLPPGRSAPRWRSAPP